MAEPKYGALSAPTDFSTELADIQRRKLLAQALQEQGMQPLGQTEMVGGWAIPRSPMEGLGKAAQQISGAYQQKELKDQEKALAQKQRETGNNDVQAFMAALQGSPDRAAIPSPPDELGGGPAAPMQPAVAGDRQKALAIALQSQSPIVQGAGSSILANMLAKKEFKLGERYNEKTGLKEKIMYDPSDPTSIVPLGGQEGVTADTAAKLKQAHDQWGGLSENQRQQLGMEAARLGISVQQLILDRARLANSNAETMFNTGTSGGVPNINIPTIPQAPQRSVTQPPVSNSPLLPQSGITLPTQPVVNPQPVNQPPVLRQPQAGALTPQTVIQPRPDMQVSPPVIAQPSAAKLPPALIAKNEAARLAQQNELAGKREYNMSGLGETIDRARSILDGSRVARGEGDLPTSSGIGAIGDYLGSVVGKSPAGAAEADQLRALGGVLVSKMPRMEGPQSDKDVENYHLMAGKIGDSTLPISRRLAALDEVEALWRKYDKGSPVAPTQPAAPVADRRAQPRSAQKRVVVDY